MKSKASTLRSTLIKMGTVNPKLRVNIRPLIAALEDDDAIASVLLGLRVGDKVEIHTQKYGKRVVEIVSNPKKGPYDIEIEIASGKVRPGHLSGGAIRIRDRKDGSGSYESEFQPTPMQQTVYILKAVKVSASVRLSSSNTFKPSNSTTVEVLPDGSVEYSDEAGTETFKSVKDAISYAKGLVDNGSGEWWADDAKKALAWLKKQ